MSSWESLDGFRHCEEKRGSGLRSVLLFKKVLLMLSPVPRFLHMDRSYPGRSYRKGLLAAFHSGLQRFSELNPVP